MDLVRELKDVRFELNLRGYDCEAVDAFLAKLRSDIASVQRENDTATGRISDLEAQLAEGGGGASSETEGTLRRTLLLAQRLADETEAESKQVASELIDSATQEANGLRATAEADAAAMREAGETDLAEARHEAAATRDATSEEAGQAREEMRQQVERILTEAEDRGAERVVIIEQAAQESTAAMREPIRAEVAELEDVRRRLLIDIGELENHLESQRVRVRTAVEALRVGMSGSIEDLERIAEDDELLATHPAPEHSGASADDVPVAPMVEIVDDVSDSVPDPVTVDEVEHDALAKMEQVAVEPVGPSTEPIPVIEAEGPAVVPVEDVVPEVVAPAEDVAPEMQAVEPAPEVAAPEGNVAAPQPIIAPVEVTPPTAAVPIEEPPTIEAPEPINVVAEADLADTDLVDLSEQPTGMFGTEVGEVVDAAPVDAAPIASAPVVGGAVVAGAGVAGAAAASALSDDAPATEATQEAPAEPQIAFVDRFAEALDALPISRQ